MILGKNNVERLWPNILKALTQSGDLCVRKLLEMKSSLLQSEIPKWIIEIKQWTKDLIWNALSNCANWLCILKNDIKFLASDKLKLWENDHVTIAKVLLIAMTLFLNKWFYEKLDSHSITTLQYYFESVKNDLSYLTQGKWKKTNFKQFIILNNDSSWNCQDKKTLSTESKLKEPENLNWIINTVINEIVSWYVDLLRTLPEWISFDPKDIRNYLLNKISSIDSKIPKSNIFKWDLEILSDNFLKWENWIWLSHFVLEIITQAVENFSSELKNANENKDIKLKFELTKQKTIWIIEYWIIPMIWSLIDLSKNKWYAIENYIKELRNFPYLNNIFENPQIECFFLSTLPKLSIHIRNKEDFLKSSKKYFINILEIIYNKQITIEEKKLLISDAILVYISDLTSAKWPINWNWIQILAKDLLWTDFTNDYLTKSVINILKSDKLPYFAKTNLVNKTVNLILTLKNSKYEAEKSEAIFNFLQYIENSILIYDPESGAGLVTHFAKDVKYNIWNSDNTTKIKWNFELFKQAWLSSYRALEFWTSKILWTLSENYWNWASTIKEHLAVSFVYEDNAWNVVSSLRQWIEFNTQSLTSSITQAIKQNTSSLTTRKNYSRNIKLDFNTYNSAKNLLLQFLDSLIIPKLKSFWMINLEEVIVNIDEFLFKPDNFVLILKWYWLKLSSSQRNNLWQLILEIHRNDQFISLKIHIYEMLLIQIANSSDPIKALQNMWDELIKLLNSTHIRQRIENTSISVAIDLLYKTSYRIEWNIVDFLTDNKLIENWENRLINYMLSRIVHLSTNYIPISKLKNFLLASKNKLVQAKDLHDYIAILRGFLNESSINLSGILKQISTDEITIDIFWKLKEKNDLFKSIDQNYTKELLTILSKIDNNDLILITKDIINIIENQHKNKHLDINEVSDIILKVISKIPNSKRYEFLKILNDSNLLKVAANKLINNDLKWELSNWNNLLNIEFVENILDIIFSLFESEYKNLDKLIGEIRNCLTQLWFWDIFYKQLMWNNSLKLGALALQNLWNEKSKQVAPSIIHTINNINSWKQVNRNDSKKIWNELYTLINKFVQKQWWEVDFSKLIGSTWPDSDLYKAFENNFTKHNNSFINLSVLKTVVSYIFILPRLFRNSDISDKDEHINAYFLSSDNRDNFVNTIVDTIEEYQKSGAG